MKRLNTRVLGYIFLATATVLGCSELLGLNTDRQLDDSYPSDGYEGCRPGETCSECTTDGHRCLCEELPECPGDGGGSNSGGAGGSGGTSGRGGSAAGSSGRSNGGGGTGGTGGQSGGGAGGSVTVDECALDTDCLVCTSCVDGCVCAGGSQTDCETQCTGFTPRDPMGPPQPPPFGPVVGPPSSCGTDTCYDLPSPSGTGHIFPACCTDTDACGYDHDLWNATPRADLTTCYPAYEPGVVTTTTNCPGYTPTVNPYLSNFDLSGCCRADGTCGYWETFLSLGCVEPGIYDQAPGDACQP